MMDPRSFQYIARACGGELAAGAADRHATGASTDSREARPGDVFFAIEGERFDGHLFLEEAAKRGALLNVIRADKRHLLPKGTGGILVDDPRAGLGRFAARYRRDFSPDMVAVAGSNGKTSTKDILTAVLTADRPCVGSLSSFNNDIGVPLTLLRIDKTHRAAVVEVGTNHPGELAGLLEIIRPTAGVLTGIGPEHLEHFADLDGVVREEGALAAAIPPGGILVIPSGCHGIESIRARCPGRVVEVGPEGTAAWHVTDVRCRFEGTRFTLRTARPGWSDGFEIPLLGAHMAMNAALALALAAELGVSVAAARRGLAACRPAKGRLQHEAIGGIHLIDDTYNANPASMRAAFGTLAALPVAGRRIVVVGDMAELGVHAGPAHAGVGTDARELGMDMVFATGNHAAQVHEGAAGGRTACRICPDVAAAVAVLSEEARPGDALLFKASRSSRLERVVEGLRTVLAGRKGPAAGVQ